MKILDKTLRPETIHGDWMKKEGKPDLVSVIIPTYNRSNYVVDAINSVWSQTYRPIELIVIDDGSTDETRKAIENWINQHSLSTDFSLRYFWQTNMGVSGARNHGLIVSEGEYIQFLDSDDLFLPERLFNCVDALKAHQEADFVHSAYYLDYSSEFSEHAGRGVIISGPASIGKKPGPAHYIWTAAGLYRRSVIIETGPWNESLRICEDAEYFSRVFVVAESSLAIPNILVRKRKHRERRLLDLQKEYEGLENKYRSLLLREKIMQSCGYDKNDLLGGWLQTAQDALSAGAIDIGRQILAHSKGMCQGIRMRLRWYLLYFSSFLPRQVEMIFWQRTTAIRNNVKWRWDIIQGKIKAESKI